MKHRRSSVGRTRLILILLCIVLAAAMLWCALSLILRIGTYSGRTVGNDPVQEQTPVEPVDLEPTVPENSYDPAGFYEEGGFKRYKSEDTLASVGVDVSSHQQEIDWELVAANGVEFAMIRVGYRGYTEGEIQPDEYFVQNIEGARAAGLDVGVYFFSQALDEQEAIDEANYVLEQIKDYPLSYPVIFDWEDIEADARTDGMDSVQLTKNAIAFCDTIKQAGYRAGVYFNQRFGYEEFDLESLQDYVFWLAEYNDTPSFSFHFQIWQYCNDGTAPCLRKVSAERLVLRALPYALFSILSCSPFLSGRISADPSVPPLPICAETKSSGRRKSDLSASAALHSFLFFLIF